MVAIDRWIDITSEEFKQIENAAWIRRFTLRAIECQAAVADKNGHLYSNPEDGESNPIHAELDGKIVGLRYAAKAAN